MAKRRQKKLPEIPEDVAAQAEAIKAQFDLFKAFHATHAAMPDHPAGELGMIVQQMIEEDEEACLTLFGAGFMCAMAGLARLMHDQIHLAAFQAHVDHTPKRNIPRA